MPLAAMELHPSAIVALLNTTTKDTHGGGIVQVGVNRTKASGESHQEPPMYKSQDFVMVKDYEVHRISNLP